MILLAMVKKSPVASRRRSSCPVACTLDLVGDRWTFLLIRDLLSGKTRYGEFLSSTEGIPSNLLAERLRRLEAVGIVERKPYQSNPPRHSYLLTPIGWELAPALVVLAKWGLRHVSHVKADEKLMKYLR
jgi:DNA-binding HxlR family transcriptional regulator